MKKPLENNVSIAESLNTFYQGNNSFSKEDESLLDMTPGERVIALKSKAITKLYYDADYFACLLRVMSRFIKMTVTDILLITYQMPMATKVYTKGCFEELGLTIKENSTPLWLNDLLINEYYDISQTDKNKEIFADDNTYYDVKSLVKIISTKLNALTVEYTNCEGMSYIYQQNKIVCTQSTLSWNQLFYYSIYVLAQRQLYVSYMRKETYIPEAVAYILCVKYGIENSNISPKFQQCLTGNEIQIEKDLQTIKDMAMSYDVFIMDEIAKRKRENEETKME